MSVLFVTGAGISASAGIATYRDGGSSWRDPDLEAKSHAARYGNHLDELWDAHWGPLAVAMKEAKPTPAHEAIGLFQMTNEESIIATQNIDDLHERGGADNVAHVHGVMKLRCMRCHRNNMDIIWEGNGAPVCPWCNKKKTRPDVVLFGEMLNKKMFRGLEHFSNDISHLIVIGTSLIVQPITGLVIDNLSTKAHTILINKDSTSFDKWFNEVHLGPADELVPYVLERVDREINA